MTHVVVHPLQGIDVHVGVGSVWLVGQGLVIGAAVAQTCQRVGQKLTAHFRFGHLVDALAAGQILAALHLGCSRLLGLHRIGEPCL